MNFSPYTLAAPTRILTILCLVFFLTIPIPIGWADHISADQLFELARQWDPSGENDSNELLHALQEGMTPKPTGIPTEPLATPTVWFTPTVTPTPTDQPPLPTETLPPQITPTPSVTSLEASHGGTGLAVTATDRMFTVELVSVYEVTSRGTELFADLFGILTILDANPHITYDAVNDCLYVAGPAQIARIGISDKVATLFASVSGSKSFEGICPDGAGNLLVARSDGIFSYNSEGVPTNLLFYRAGMVPQDIARGSDGSLYVTATHYPRKINDEGALYVRRPGGDWQDGTRFFAGPYYLTYHPGGYLFVSNLKADQVSILDAQTLEVERFIPVVFWPRGIGVLSSGDVMVAHFIEKPGGDWVAAYSRFNPQVATDWTPAQITLSHSDLAGQSLTMWIHGEGVDLDVPANNRVYLGETPLDIKDYTFGPGDPREPGIAVELPLIPIPELTNNLAWQLPGDEICVKKGHTVSNRIKVTGPAPGELRELVLVSQSVPSDFPEQLAVGSWVWIRTDDICTLHFPDGQFPDHELTVGESFLMPVQSAGTFRMEVIASSWSQSFSSKGIFGANRSQIDNLLVDTDKDFGWFLNGIRLEIPAGTIPGDQTVELSLSTTQLTPLFGYLVMGPGFQAKFEPEPVHLNHAITITVPYDPAEMGLETEKVHFGVSDNGAFYELQQVTKDIPAKRFVWQLPSGAYQESLPMEKSNAKSSAVDPQNHTINQVLNEWAVWGIAPTANYLERNGIRVWGNQPDKSDYIQSIMTAGEKTIQVYNSLGYQMPDQFNIYIENLGTADTVGGYTTKGVFGTPWVVINDGLDTASGRGLDWNVAHELFHVAQREIHVHMTLHWTDEATAQWGASKVYPDSVYYLDGINGLEQVAYGGVMFAVNPIPPSYRISNSSYSTNQAYLAMAMMKYIAEISGDSAIKTLIEKDDEFFANNFYAALETATSKSIGEFADAFGKAFWTQTFDKARSHGIAYSNWNLELYATDLGDLSGSEKTFSTSRPAYSSNRLTLSIPNDLAANYSKVELQGSQSSSDHFVYVYGDPNQNKYVLANGWVSLGPLGGDPEAVMTVDIRNFSHLRFISVNSGDKSSTVSVTVRPVANTP